MRNECASANACAYHGRPAGRVRVGQKKIWSAIHMITDMCTYIQTRHSTERVHAHGCATGCTCAAPQKISDRFLYATEGLSPNAAQARCLCASRARIRMGCWRSAAPSAPGRRCYAPRAPALSQFQTFIINCGCAPRAPAAEPLLHLLAACLQPPAVAEGWIGNAAGRVNEPYPPLGV